MQKRTIVLNCWFLLVIFIFLFGCEGIQKPAESNFKNPVITLSHLDFPYYTGFWFYSDNIMPVKGEAGNHGASMQVAFIFEVANSNSYAVMMDGFKFTVKFEEFVVDIVYFPEQMWIPAGKTNQLRVSTVVDLQQTRLNLLVQGGEKLKDKKISLWDILEKWWTEAPNSSYPIHASQGSARFTVGGDVNRVVAF